MKGVTARQVKDVGITLILNNTYHLGLRPGTEILDLVGGLFCFLEWLSIRADISTGAHEFQGWRGNLLTDSGGFQMVSL